MAMLDSDVNLQIISEWVQRLSPPSNEGIKIAIQKLANSIDSLGYCVLLAGTFITLAIIFHAVRKAGE